MRVDSLHKPTLLLATVLLPLTACGGGYDERQGAPSPQALLDKLLSGLDELHAERVASCFDTSTNEGSAVAELMRRTVDILQQGRALEMAVREKFGHGYADGHVAVKTPALMVERLRERLETARLTVEDNIARLHVGDGVDAEQATTMYTRYKLWFFAAPAPFAGDAELRLQVGRLLDVFARHIQRAMAAAKAARSEREFRVQMATVAKETKRTCAPLLATVTDGFQRHGLLRK
ncbi:MAG: hypothetical protein ACYTGW_20650 [Planctomycetota bacterium]|jgi:hypothetical protein